MKGLVALDVFLTFLHLLIIGFNLFGWIWKKTRKWHFILVVVTAASWFVLGIWFGLGYCPITDWQWQVKYKLGEQNLPASFVEYYAEKVTAIDISTSLIDMVTGGAFLLAAIMSIYFNFFHYNRNRKAKT